MVKNRQVIKRLKKSRTKKKDFAQKIIILGTCGYYAEKLINFPSSFSLKNIFVALSTFTMTGERLETGVDSSFGTVLGAAIQEGMNWLNWKSTMKNLKKILTSLPIQVALLVDTVVLLLDRIRRTKHKKNNVANEVNDFEIKLEDLQTRLNIVQGDVTKVQKEIESTKEVMEEIQGNFRSNIYIVGGKIFQQEQHGKPVKSLNGILQNIHTQLAKLDGISSELFIVSDEMDTYFRGKKVDVEFRRDLWGFLGIVSYGCAGGIWLWYYLQGMKRDKNLWMATGSGLVIGSMCTKLCIHHRQILQNLKQNSNELSEKVSVTQKQIANNRKDLQESECLVKDLLTKMKRIGEIMTIQINMKRCEYENKQKELDENIKRDERLLLKMETENQKKKLVLVGVVVVIGVTLTVVWTYAKQNKRMQRPWYRKGKKTRSS